MDSSRTTSQQRMRFPFVGSDKLIYAIDGISQFLIHYIIEIDRRMDIGRLTEAIELAGAKTPILKSLARLRWIAPYWEVMEEFTPQSILTVWDCSQEVHGEEVVDALIQKCINEYIDITKSPPLKCYLIQLPEERTIFIIKTHHCPFDAAALFQVTEDIRRYYEALCSGEARPSIEAMGDRSRIPLLHGVSPFLWLQVILMALWRAVRSFPSPRKRFIQFSGTNESGGISYRSVRFRGQDYETFRARSRALGINSNEFILAALCRAIYKWNGESGREKRCFAIVMPVDLRRYVMPEGKAPRVMASFVGGTKLCIPTEDVTTLHDAGECVARETRFIKNHHLALLPNMVFPLLYLVHPGLLRRVAQRLYEHRPDWFIPTMVVSNLGKVDRVLSSSVHFPVRSFEAVGTAYSPAGLFVAPFSFSGEQVITITYRKDVCQEREINEFVAILSEELVPPHGGNLSVEKSLSTGNVNVGELCESTIRGEV